MRRQRCGGGARSRQPLTCGGRGGGRRAGREGCRLVCELAHCLDRCMIRQTFTKAELSTLRQATRGRGKKPRAFAESNTATQQAGRKERCEGNGWKGRRNGRRPALNTREGGAMVIHECYGRGQARHRCGPTGSRVWQAEPGSAPPLQGRWPGGEPEAAAARKAAPGEWLPEGLRRISASSALISHSSLSTRLLPSAAPLCAAPGDGAAPAPLRGGRQGGRRVSRCGEGEVGGGKWALAGCRAASAGL